MAGHAGQPALRTDGDLGHCLAFGGEGASGAGGSRLRQKGPGGLPCSMQSHLRSMHPAGM